MRTEMGTDTNRKCEKQFGIDVSTRELGTPHPPWRHLVASFLLFLSNSFLFFNLALLDQHSPDIKQRPTTANARAQARG